MLSSKKKNPFSSIYPFNNQRIRPHEAGEFDLLGVISMWAYSYGRG